MNYLSRDAYIDKVQKCYSDLVGDLHLLELTQTGSGLGLSLAGNRDLGTMSVLVVGIHPGTPAALSGLVRIGDELLEINHQVLYGRSHLNAAAIIKSVTSARVNLLILRTKNYLERLAVQPLKFSSIDYLDDTRTLLPRRPRLFSTEGSGSQEDDSSLSLADRSPVITNSDLVNSTAASSQHYANDFHNPTGDVPETSRVCQGGPVPKLTKSKRVDEDDVTINCNDITVTERSDSKDSGYVALGFIRDKVKGITHQSSDDSSFSIPPPQLCLPSTQDDPATCAIELGREMVIDICRGKSPLGVKVIGGADTVLKTICVFEIYTGGAAAKDGRLRVGDQILEVSCQNLRMATELQAMRLIHKAPSTVRLTVYRSKTPPTDDGLYESLTVDLVKKPGKGLGISVAQQRDEGGIYIADIVKGSIADADGRLLVNDQIVSVNSEDVRVVMHDDAVMLLKTLTGKVTMTVRRLKSEQKTNTRQLSATPSHNGNTVKRVRSGAFDWLSKRSAAFKSLSASY